MFHLTINWYVVRTFWNWTIFVDQCINTFERHELDMVDRLKSECIIEYFHHKTQLRCEILLLFNEIKKQIVEVYTPTKFATTLWHVRIFAKMNY